VKKYQIIYADPPWQYDFSKSNSRKIENQYPTMPVSEICSLPIPSDDNAVLYLWATAPKLREALLVMESWGFNYKTHAIWDKEIIGMGYWFRSQHELLLVGVKGNFPPPEQSLRVPSIIKSKRAKHSEKPQLIMDLIESWYPDKTKVELFTRRKRMGWDCWGNEVDSDITLAPPAQSVINQHGARTGPRYSNLS
jgi:N6-adenosine-specific RNA methylase IME4